MTEYRIDDLAREAGTTVRNVRVYQERGLIPPPEKRGRAGYYSDEHLARLKMISRLLARGYTFATIGELFAAWRHGWRLEDVIGLEEAVVAPWSDEAPETVSLGDLKALFGRQATKAAISRACELGILIPAEVQRFMVPSPGLFGVGRELAHAGTTAKSAVNLNGELKIVSNP